MPERERRIIGIGALLHDVGKIAVPDHILLKPAELTEEEWAEMRRHPMEGYKLLKRIGFLKDAAEIVYAHHEHFDGNGYPRGLKGNEIPLGGRLFMVADVYMTPLPPTGPTVLPWTTMKRPKRFSARAAVILTRRWLKLSSR